MAKPFVVIEGYSDEDAPRRITECETIREASVYFAGVLREIAEDYEILREERSDGTLDPSVFGWREGRRKRYCAVRRSAS